MKIILLDKIPNLGDIADVVEVNSGYARNFLIPQKKAMFASKNNLEYVAERKAELAAASADEVSRAEAKATQLKDQSVEIKVPVTDEGALYGSVGTREISDAFAEKNLEVDKSYVQLPDGAYQRDRRSSDKSSLLNGLIDFGTNSPPSSAKPLRKTSLKVKFF